MVISNATKNTQSGAQSIFYFPKAVSTLQVSTDTSSSLKLKWTAVSAGPEYNQIATGYDIRFALTPLNQNNFYSASSMAAPPLPLPEGNVQTTTLPGLDYDALYYVGMAVLDGTNLKNMSYISNVVSKRTLAPKPTALVCTPNSSEKKISFEFNTNNPAGKQLDFKVQISKNPGFSPLVSQKTPNNETVGLYTDFFNNLDRGSEYYLRVCSLNQAGLPSDWETQGPISLSGGAPVIQIPSDVTSSSAKITWTKKFGLSNGYYYVTYDTVNTFTDTPVTLPILEADAHKLSELMVPGLDPNKAYFFKVFGYKNAGSDDFLGESMVVSTVTHVKKPITVSGVDVFATSATVKWTDHSGNGTGIHGFSVHLSSSSSFATLVEAPREVPYIGSPEITTTFTGLKSNTSFYVKIVGINSAGAYSGGADIYTSPAASPVFITKPAPVLLVKKNPADPVSQIAFEWGAGSNNGDTTTYHAKLYKSANCSANLIRTVSLPPGSVLDLTMASAVGSLIYGNAEYSVCVTAEALDGNPVNNAVSSPLIVHTKPMAPEITTGDIVPMLNQIRVGWSNQKSPTVINDLGTNYTVEWLDRGFLNSLPNAGPPFELVLPGLDPNDLIPITIRSETGSLDWVFQETSTQIYTLADNPTGASFFPTTTSMELKWDRALNPLGTEFQARISTDIGFDPLITTSTVVLSTFTTFVGLTPNQRYFGRAYAINHDGILSSPSQTSSFTKPAKPVILPFVKSSTTLLLGWDAQGNNDRPPFPTRYYPSINRAEVGPLLGTTYLFDPLPVNSSHTFEVRAKANDGVSDVVSNSTTVYTWADTPPKPLLESTIDLTRLVISFAPGSNPPTTEYAIQVFRDPMGLGESPHGQYLNAVDYVLSPAGIGVPGDWKRLSDWGVFDGVRYRAYLRIGSGGIPTDGNWFVKIKARNGQAEETGLSEGEKIELKAGPPQVSLRLLSGEVVTTADSLARPIYDNRSVIPFEAQGSGHFNFRFNTDQIDWDLTPPNLIDQTSSIGWNGEINASEPCSDGVGDPASLFAGALKGFCYPAEDVYYLHIIGNQIQGGTLLSSYLASPPSFRIYIDTTAPDAGSIKALSDGYLITNNNSAPLGFQTIDFSWGLLPDGGNSASRSPIVGWSFSFSTNAGDMPPLANAGPNFLPHSATPMKIINLGDPAMLPDTETYYFKVVGLDQAGNWQGTPSEFVYHFKKDVVPPHFVEASLSGTRLPKGNTPRDFHFAAVDPTQPIRLIFSEEVNLDAPGSLSFIQTHDALGVHSSTPIPYIVSTSPVDGTHTQMNLTAALLPGARYQIVSSTSLLRDLGGNRLPEEEKFTVVFYTLLNPAAPTVIASGDPGEEFRLEIAAGAVGVGPSGISFDDEVQNDPHSVGNVVRKASGAMSRRSGGVYNQVLASKEFNHYKPDGTQLKGNFDGKVRLVFPYASLAPDADGVCQNVPGGRPVLETKLAIYQLDELSGSWMKMPGSRVDTVAKEVSVDLQHFSVYALIGAASFDLTDAHPYPVPYKAAEHPAGITFVFPNADLATVKVYTLDGRLVKTLSDNMSTGFVRWNPVTNDDGDPVASDVYLYVIENDQERRVGKLMVIR